MKLLIRNIEKLILNKLFLPFVYAYYSRKNVEKGLVLMADARHSEIPSHMTYMYDSLKQQGYIVENWCVDFESMALHQKVVWLFRFMKRYAVSNYVFLCDYFIPIASCSKRNETKVIQLWHAGGMLKKFGYDAAEDLGKNKGLNQNKNIDLWTVSSPECVPIFEKACGLSKENVQPLGISRTDVYFEKTYRDNCAHRFYEKYPELQGKKLLLWAPTFRNNAHLAQLDGMEDIKKLQEELGNGWHVLIKVHPHLAKKYDINNCNILTEELYPIVDLLVTDYSSVVFDYCLFDKPFLVFAPDYDAYMKQRGCYIDMERDFPYPIARTVEELVMMITEDEMDLTRVKLFRQKYMSACDGKSSERILEYLRKNKM